MKCAYDAELLSRYLEEDLPPEEMDAAEAHLEECHACRKELERLSAAMEIMKSVQEVAVPRNYAETVKVR
jgi:anti-sigma factor RsiW